MIFEQRKKNLSYRLTDYLLDFSRCLFLLLLDDFVFAPAVSDGRVNVVILLYYLGLIKYRCIYATSDNKSLLSIKVYYPLVIHLEKEEEEEERSASAASSDPHVAPK